jgi:hypothetical protein
VIVTATGRGDNESRRRPEQTRTLAAIGQWPDWLDSGGSDPAQLDLETGSTVGDSLVSIVARSSGTESNLPAATGPANPYRNPSYPPRTHVLDRGTLLASLAAIDDRVASFRKVLDARPAGPGRAELERLYHQTLGARDQVADAVRRLPQEAGSLYGEDRHLYEIALKAFERLSEQWNRLSN